ncbi:MAG: hypothetical protein AAF702_28095 [Chloroflexota bacterium]
MHQSNSLIRRSISTALLALIILFALTTIGNVAKFVGKYHAGFTGWTLGTSIGATVFLSSYLFSIARTQRTKWTALVIAIAFGLTSAGFQTALYMIEGNAPWYVAVALSFIPIVFGETGLAILESNYSDEAESDGRSEQIIVLEQQVKQLTTQSESVEGIQEQLASLQEAMQKQEDAYRQDMEAISTQRDDLLTLVAQLEKQVDELNPLSLISRMPDKYREGLSSLVEIVSAENVKNAADFHRLSTLSKSLSYELFNLAKAINVIELDPSTEQYVVKGKV